MFVFSPSCFCLLIFHTLFFLKYLKTLFIFSVGLSPKTSITYSMGRILVHATAKAPGPI